MFHPLTQEEEDAEVSSAQEKLDYVFVNIMQTNIVYFKC